jgi:nucleoside-diphosphate-sugar epimerase
MLDKQKNIFLTGATGFLGAYILRTLIKEGYTKLYASCRDSSKFDLIDDVKKSVNWCKGDLSDPLFLEDCLSQMNIVIHAAALVNANAREKAKVDKSNIELTKNLVNTSLDSGIERFIYISSVAALGFGEADVPIHEHIEWKNDERNTVYANSKHFAEREVFRGAAEGLNVVVLNPSLILGAGVWDSSTVSIFNLVEKGMKYYPAGSVGIVDVRDVAQAVNIALYNDDMLDKRFIISGENWTHLKMATEIAEALRVNAPTKLLTPFLTKLSKRVLSLLESFGYRNELISAERIGTANSKFAYDNKASLAIGLQYTPIKRTISETVQEYIQSKNDNSSFGLLNI